MAQVKRLTIFEGSDGSGKSTAAQRYAAETGARYVHFGPVPQIKKSLARIYVEAMLPALLGYQDVVFDRSWLSEVPYGTAFREGVDRLGDVQRRMLERLALRCGTVVVNCRPAWDVVLENYLRRKQLEMLENDVQLRQVYDLYGGRLATVLPQAQYDYTNQPDVIQAMALYDHARPTVHLTEVLSAGDLEADVLLVGEAFAEPKEQDSFYQWPFASFSGSGCSQWLTQQLMDAGISERAILWVNADQDVPLLFRQAQPGIKVIALGNDAHVLLGDFGIEHQTVQHPQAQKRFHASEDYDLITLLEEIC